jgi:hypothetical protein
LNDCVDLDIERPMEHNEDDGRQVSRDSGALMVDGVYAIGRRPDHDDVVVCHSLYFYGCASGRAFSRCAQLIEYSDGFPSRPNLPPAYC